AVRHALRRLSESAGALEAEIEHLEVELRVWARPPAEWARRMALASLLPLLLLGPAQLPAVTAYAQEQAPRERPLSNVRIDSLATGYQRGGSLGFALRDTTIEEEL